MIWDWDEILQLRYHPSTSARTFLQTIGTPTRGHAQGEVDYVQGHDHEIRSGTQLT